MNLNRSCSCPFLAFVLLVYLSTSTMSCGGGSGGSSPGSGSNNPSSPIGAQVQDVANWQIYQGKDNTNTSVLANYSLIDRIYIALGKATSSFLGKRAIALDLSGVTTYSSTGLIGEVLRFLYIDEDYLVTGTNESGYSAIKLSNLTSPKGNILNYRGSPENQSKWDTFGYQGAIKRDSDGYIYAWYGNDIVQVNTSTVVYSQAPHPQGSIYSSYAYDRMVFDVQGNLWMGAINLDSDGTPRNDFPDSNGLYRISADFSGKTQVLDSTHSVWNLFRDTQNIVWASTNKGVYRIAAGQNPVLVFDGSLQSRWSSQIIEYAGGIYSVVKNFFHNPNALGNNLIFELFRWDGNTFLKTCDIYTGHPFDNSAFIWRGDLYVTRQGPSTLIFNGFDAFSAATIGATGIEGFVAKSAGDVIASVQNISGLQVYNLNGDGQLRKLTPANTSEGLIGNILQSLYLDSDHSLYIGPEASGFNKMSREVFYGYELANEFVISGIYNYNGKVHISGTSATYYLDNEETSRLTFFLTNGGRLRLDQEYLWALKDWNSWSNGRISFLNLETLAKTEDILFDQPYKFYDVIRIPNEDAVYIGVGRFTGQTMIDIATPFVLKYNYSNQSHEKINLPTGDSKGIFKFFKDGETIYGVSDRRLYTNRNGIWEFFCPVQMVSSVTSINRVGNYLFITSNNDSTRGLEIVDLSGKTSEHFNSQTVALPSDQVNDMVVETVGVNQYRLWFATRNGLASCDIEMPSTP